MNEVELEKFKSELKRLLFKYDATLYTTYDERIGESFSVVVGKVHGDLACSHSLSYEMILTNKRRG